MKRLILTALAAALIAPLARAQNVVPVSHGSHPHVAHDGGSCADGKCGSCAACNDCLRINDIKKTQVPVYDCKVKEICIPQRSLLSLLGCAEPGCKKIEVRQLVKRYRTDEECVSVCITQEEAAKRAEAELKKQKATQPSSMPVPSRLPTAATPEQEITQSSGWSFPAALQFGKRN